MKKKKVKKTSRKINAVLLEENKKLKKQKEELEKEKERMTNDSDNLRCLLSKQNHAVGEKYLPQEMLKTSLLMLGTVLCAIIWLWIGCFSQAIDVEGASVLGFVYIALISTIMVVCASNVLNIFKGSFIMGILLGGFAIVVIKNELSPVISLIAISLLSIATFLFICFSSYNIKENNFSIWSTAAAIVAFGLITIPGAKPLTKYHEVKLLQRDAAIAALLQITSSGENAEIILPSEFISDNRYLKNVLLVKTDADPNEISWNGNSIFCKEGEIEWYKMPVQTQDGKITLRFRHNYQDYTETKKIARE